MSVKGLNGQSGQEVDSLPVMPCTAAFRLVSLVSHETFKMAFSAVHLSHATEPTTSRQR